MKAAKVEQIYPLTYQQELLLLHHLYQTDDQGVIQLSCDLHGPLEEAPFHEAWATIMQRHETLRSSVHWETLKKPVRVIRPSVEFVLQAEDLRDLAADAQKAKLTDFANADAKQPITLTEAPLMRLHLFRLEDAHYRLFWTSHHIILDGWSSSIVLQDVLAQYEANISNSTANLPSVPSYKNYLQWLKQQDTNAGKLYWQACLADQADCLLPQQQTLSGSSAFGEKQWIVNEEILTQTTRYLKSNGLTFNTLVRAVWGLVLSKYFDDTKVVYGTTHAGRNTTLPNMDRIAGLFTRVMPVQVAIDETLDINIWLQSLQKEHAQANTFQHLSLAEILGRTAQEDIAVPFNTLLLVQNHDWSLPNTASIAVSNYQGDITATFPMTLIAVPQEQTIHFYLRYAPNYVTAEQADWWTSTFNKAWKATLTSDKVASIIGQLSAPLIQKTSVPTNRETPATPLVSDSTTLQLQRIWQTLLPGQAIGIDDDFFAIGGSSILALKLTAQIERTFGQAVAPAALVQHRTIRELSQLLKQEQTTAWDTIVPLKAQGNDVPVFCVHAGEGHIFFYQDLAQQMGQHPTYAIQPSGLDGQTDFHSTIEAMAAHYRSAIRAIYPEGPYALLTYCFSNAVGLEICHQELKTSGEQPFLVVIDSAPTAAQLKNFYKTNRAHRGRRWMLERLLKMEWKALSEEMAIRYWPASLAQESLQAKQFERKRQSHFVPALDQYVWSSYEGPVALMRSEEFASQERKQFHVDIWQHLANDQLRIYPISGKHRALFNPGHAEVLARQISTFIHNKA